MSALTLSALPDPLLVQILELLPLQDRMSGARVCRHWRLLVRNKCLWRHVDLTDYDISTRVLWHLLRNYFRGGLQTLRLRGFISPIRKQKMFSSALMGALGRQCPHLHHLYLTLIDLRPVSYDCLPPSLTTLELIACEIPSAWFHVPRSSQIHQAFPQLQHLIVKNVPAFSSQHLVHIAQQGTLKTVLLFGTDLVTNWGVQTAAPNLGELESLTLSQCSINDSATPFIRRHMKRLRFLDLSISTCLTDSGLSCLGGLASLEDLRLQSCQGLSPQAVAATCQALPRLKHLDLTWVHFDASAIRQIQAGLPNCVVTCPSFVRKGIGHMKVWGLHAFQ